jgi:hypothetical protein
MDYTIIQKYSNSELTNALHQIYKYSKREGEHNFNSDLTYLNQLREDKGNNHVPPNRRIGQPNHLSCSPPSLTMNP